MCWTILAELRDLNRWRGPVPGSVLADFVARPERTVRWWLRRMERMGLVERPRGRCSGWVVRMGVPMQEVLL